MLYCLLFLCIVTGLQSLQIPCIISDLQVFWNACIDDKKSIGCRYEQIHKLSQEQLVDYNMDIIQKHLDTNECSVLFHIGDQTAYGDQNNDLIKYHSVIKRIYKNIPVYPVLGNHDIANPNGDCHENKCALGAMDDYFNRIKHFSVVDYKIEHEQKTYWIFMIFPKKCDIISYTGSFAYLVQYDGIAHIVLNYFPTFTTKIHNGVLGSMCDPRVKYTITSSIEWLKRQMSKYNKVMLYVHDLITALNDKSFNDLCHQYKDKIILIHGGHYHLMRGWRIHNGIKVFQHGAPYHYNAAKIKNNTIYQLHINEDFSYGIDQFKIT